MWPYKYRVNGTALRMDIFHVTKGNGGLGQGERCDWSILEHLPSEPVQASIFWILNGFLPLWQKKIAYVGTNV